MAILNSEDAAIASTVAAFSGLKDHSLRGRPRAAPPAVAVLAPPRDAEVRAYALAIALTIVPEWYRVSLVRYVAAIPLLLCYLALGSGTLDHLHSLEHQREDAALAQAAGLPPTQQPVHNDSNCQTHAQLHMPMVSMGWVPLLVCLGLFVAFLTQLAPALVPQRTLSFFDCRGPPADCLAPAF